MLQLRGTGEAESRGGDRATAWPGWILEARSWPRGPGARRAGTRESRAERPRAGSSGGRGFGPHRAARARLGQQSRQVLHQVPLLLDLLCGEGSERSVTSGASSEEPSGNKQPAGPRPRVPGQAACKPRPTGPASTPRPRPATVPPPGCPQVPPQPSQRPRPSPRRPRPARVPPPSGPRPRPHQGSVPARHLEPELKVSCAVS